MSCLYCTGVFGPAQVGPARPTQLIQCWQPIIQVAEIDINFTQPVPGKVQCGSASNHDFIPLRFNWCNFFESFGNSVARNRQATSFAHCANVLYHSRASSPSCICRILRQSDKLSTAGLRRLEAGPRRPAPAPRGPRWANAPALPGQYRWPRLASCGRVKAPSIAP